MFGQGNDFCKKITYQHRGRPEELIARSFRNDYNPRIAVTVDMIATGTDVKPLEVPALHARREVSQGYYEQMKGRGVRSLDARQPEAREQ